MAVVVVAARVSSERRRDGGRRRRRRRREGGVRRWATEGGRRGRETSGEGSDVPIREAQAMLLLLLWPLLQFTLKRDNARCDHSELQAPTPPSLHSAHQLSVGEHFPHTYIMYSFLAPADHQPSAAPACTKLKRRRRNDGGGRGQGTTCCVPPWPLLSMAAVVWCRDRLAT